MEIHTLSGMKNSAVKSPVAPDAIRVARATFVRDSLKSERWSTRAAALAIGSNHNSLGARLRGDTAFLAEDLEAIAGLLKRNPVEFYGAYLMAGMSNAPTPVTGGGDLVGPAGIEPTTSTVKFGRFGRRAAETQEHPADVIPFPTKAASAS